MLIPLNIKDAFLSDSTSLNVTSSGRIHKSKDIFLPNQTELIHHIGIDIGGTLAKVTYFTRSNEISSGGHLKFFKIETEKINEFITYLKKLIIAIEIENNILDSRHGVDYYLKNFTNHKINLHGTGGGSIKFSTKLCQELQLTLRPKNLPAGQPFLKTKDEMQCLITGLNFLINNVPNEVFLYDDNTNLKIEDDRKLKYVNQHKDVYPYLLVNIGSGVSMIKVTGPQSFERIGGSSIGGGTLWGLLSLLTNARTYDDMLSMASNGDNANVDMLVGDIYGTSYNKIGLKSNAIASSFGKVFKTVTGKMDGGYNMNDDSVYGSDSEYANGNYNETSMAESTESLESLDSQDETAHGSSGVLAGHDYPSVSQFQRLSKFKQSDISKSLLYAVSNNIGQIAYLQAEKHKLNRIFFAGSFIRNHLQTVITLSYAINFWSSGQKKAYFLRHEGYLGSLGAFVSSYEDQKLYYEYLFPGK